MGETSYYQSETPASYKKDEPKCATLSPYKCEESKYENATIRQLIKEIKNDLQDPKKSWAPEAVQKLQGEISFIEKEYDTIPQLVAAYEQFYLDLKESGAKYCTAERQWAAIKEWVAKVTDTDLDQLTKNAIEDLRNSNYRDENDDDFKKYCDETNQHDNPTHPKCILDKAQKDFTAIKSYFDQRKDEEEEITKIYVKKKDFKKTVEDWLGALKTLHEKANDFNMKKKYRSLYAIYLEASQVWKKIKRLSSDSEPQDSAWFQKDLTQALKKSLIAKHELFLWHDDWLRKQNALAKAKAAYEAFISIRLKDFLREAEDVPPKAVGTATSTAQQASTQAAPTTSIDTSATL
jgi:hypothetical protein